MRSYRFISAFMLALAALVTAPVVMAQAAGTGIDFSGSGFLTAAAGRIMRGTHDSQSDQGYHCPCFISDYAQNGVYESGRVRFGPDSKLGYQATLSTSDRRLSLTGQLVSRGAANGRLDPEWLYASYDLSSKFTVQTGRKRLPLFAYSELQDVGFALPWIHLPPQVYGWEVVNYNGANLLYRDSWGSCTSALNLFFGAGTARDSGFQKIYNGKDSRTDVRWPNIAGAEAKLSRGAFEVRYVYMQSQTQSRLVSAGETDFSAPARQRIHGGSLGYESGGWLARTEILWINRTESYGGDHARLFALGRLIGRFTPMLTYSNYRMSLNDPAAPIEAHDTRSAVLRYDLTNSSALKVQYDFWRDRSGAGLRSPHGNSQLLSLSYDQVF
jgi:hypothetical protein